jgi:hypothetical protein
MTDDVRRNEHEDKPVAISTPQKLVTSPSLLPRTRRSGRFTPGTPLADAR